MAAQGATLQNYNNELVKCVDDLKEKREEINKAILKDVRFLSAAFFASYCQRFKYLRRQGPRSGAVAGARGRGLAPHPSTVLTGLVSLLTPRRRRRKTKSRMICAF